MTYIFYTWYNVPELPFRKCTYVSMGGFLIKIFSEQRQANPPEHHKNKCLFCVYGSFGSCKHSALFHFKTFKGCLCRSESPQSLDFSDTYTLATKPTSLSPSYNPAWTCPTCSSKSSLGPCPHPTAGTRCLATCHP